MIERDVTQGIVDVDWTDDARVKVWMRKRQMKFTITEAKALRADLDDAIAEASRAAEGLVRAVEPMRFDLVEVVLSPECMDEFKHRACIGRAWSQVADDEVRCECPCHAEVVAA